MAEIAFVVKVQDYTQARLGNFIAQGTQLCELIAKDLPLGTPRSVRLLQVLKSDSHLVPDVYAAAGEKSEPTSARAGVTTTTKTTIAGGAAGAHTVTGIKATDTLKAAISVDDTSHAATDVTAEMVITADTATNTAGTDTTGGHIVFVYDRT